MYILIVARGYPTEKYKLNGIFEFDQAVALSKMGHKVIYACVDLRSIRRKRKWGFEQLEKNGVKIEAINIPCGRIPPKILNRAGVKAFKKLYNRIVRLYGVPDIVHAHFIFQGYLIARHFHQATMPLVLTEHLSTMNQRVIEPYYYQLGQFTYPRIDKVLAVSSHLGCNITQKFDVQTDVMANIVTTDIFSYDPMKKDENLFYFVSVGNLTPDKNMKFLVKKFIDCFHDNENIKLYIFGDGPEKSEIEKIIIEHDMQGRIYLCGVVERSEIAQTFRACDCFVLLSKHETFGVVYIEALASGLPVVATRCGGPEDFVDESNGILVDADNETEIEAALREMYGRAKNFDKKNISQKTIAKFSPKTIAEGLINTYEAVIGAKKHKS